MQLNLSIELTPARGKVFQVELMKNGQSQGLVSAGNLSLEVSDGDQVTLQATGKGTTGTVVGPDGSILEDISLRITRLELADMNFLEIIESTDIYNDSGEKLTSIHSLYCDGTIVIDIDNLIFGHYNYKSVPMLTLEQVALEVLGRPTTISLNGN